MTSFVIFGGRKIFPHSFQESNEHERKMEQIGYNFHQSSKAPKKKDECLADYCRPFFHQRHQWIGRGYMNSQGRYYLQGNREGIGSEAETTKREEILLELDQDFDGHEQLTNADSISENIKIKQEQLKTEIYTGVLLHPSCKEGQHIYWFLYKYYVLTCMTFE
ncbi:uncharacterized protein LOC132030852 isoform X3 [Lycium ferocissimum]|uniref:uncharacterized protein LOC132030852 isoform X3 n=2 Tax=Lycium ferocissimum TaxID=112874 RepID=UPI00281606CC|nr:uncharacterized protein LOC132030852 isoform X3 [Lycium ferocissimum]